MIDHTLLDKLYEFGGLYVYRVKYFDTVTFTVKETKPTFNRQVADDEVNRLHNLNIDAVLVQELVHFDSAYSKEENKMA